MTNEPESLPMSIASTRLLLRPWRQDDVDAVLAQASDPEWARFLPVPVPYARSDAEAFVSIQLGLDPARNPSWAITRNGALVGGINIRLDPAHRTGELGYSVAREAWGQGIATEALRAVLDAAFVTLPWLDRVRAMADLRNLASQRVMEKNGMQREGVLRRNRVVRGESIDEAWYGLLREEWLAGRR